MKTRLLRATLWSIALLALPAATASFWWANRSRSQADAPAPTPRAARTPTATDTLFASKIRPVLDRTCLRCHGGKKTRGGLRVDSRAALLRGGDSGPALVPGNAGKSLLIQVIRHTHEELEMPPGKKLPAAVIADFVAWVNKGAPWPEESPGRTPGRTPKRWAFTPVKVVQPPPDPSGWSANAIDRFVQAKLHKHGLTPAGPADKRTLIRRVTFDVIGLPPTPAEVDAFLADRSPDAFARVVDRLLASPHYGERWARHWLDVVRYADTGGFEADHLYPGAWKFRDWVIRSFNAHKPFDRFLHEQVAGDELWPADPDARLATGLYCVGPALAESAMTANQLEYEWLTDAADTTGAAFLGLTFGCARCHDHKYDPISQKDYFALQAVFAASDRPFSGKIRLLRIKALNGLLSEAPVPRRLLNDPRCTLRTEKDVGLRLFHRRAPLAVRRLARGELSKPRELVAPAVPAALRPAGRAPDFGEAPPGKRRALLARWLTAPDNPLTARVLVNRVWGWHFGRALVRTPNDFGAQGEPPSHPELLDWLASDFVRHGWSLPRLHRLILLSSTYRMGSVAEGHGLAVDPEDRLLWHFPRRRLEGEAIRDALLACAGTLNRRPFGRPVVPPLGRQELTGLFDARAKWPVTRDARQHARRSVYLLVRRTFTYPLFAAFDAPDVMVSCPQRTRTVVPTQALTLLNSPLVREQSAAFARRLIRECGKKPEALVARAWRLAFARPATPNETKRALSFLRKRAARGAGSPPAGSLRSRRGTRDSGSRGTYLELALAELCLALFNANEFIYLD
jgi:hypothetical protein